MVKTDAQLVAQVRLGDLESFGTLVERYERTLLAVALGVLRDFHRAEDVVQATLLLAFRRLSTLQDDDKFGAWVIQIARTQALEAARSHSVPATVSLGPEHELSDEVWTNGWIEFEQVLSLVAQLPDPDRVLIGLRYFDGHSMSEIASLVGRPLGTITKQLSRAIVRLRHCSGKGESVMNARNSLEDRLETIGAALRSRPSLADRVMTQVRSAAGEYPTSAVPPVIRAQPRRRFLGSAAAAALAIGAVALLAIVFPSSSAVSWAQVAQALKAQSWIRGQVTHANGKRATIWISPERQVWALKLDPSISFFDGREYAKYEYRGGAAPITKLPLGEADAQRVLPLEAIAADKDSLGPWLLGSEMVLQQERHQVTEDGKTWIEFQLTLARGDMTKGTLRVDPKTKLPVSLLFTSLANEEVTKFEFDYPAEGPADIYALGVPREVKIDEPVPLKGTVELLKAIAASRAKIGKFQLIVGQPVGGFGDGPVYPASLVSREGNRWRIDGCLPPGVPGAGPPLGGAGWDLWAADQVRRGTLVPLYACDGQTIWENVGFPAADGFRWEVSTNATPQSLMSGQGLGMLSKAMHANFAALLYPDLAPQRGWSFEIDPKPADYPGCLLVKRSAEMASPEPLVGYEWYYLDPAKGHAVVRIEMFSETPGKPAVPAASKYRQTIEMNDFQQAPGGWWYCTEIVDIKPARAADDPPQRTTVRYAFDFDADLPAEFGPARIK